MRHVRPQWLFPRVFVMWAPLPPLLRCSASGAFVDATEAEVSGLSTTELLGLSVEEGDVEALASVKPQAARPPTFTARTQALEAAVLAACAPVSVFEQQLAARSPHPSPPGAKPLQPASLAASLRAAGFHAVAVNSTLSPSARRRAYGTSWLFQNHVAVDDPASLSAVIIVDSDVRSPFEMARPTAAFLKLLDALPPVFVGGEGAMRALVHLLAKEAHEAYAASGLPVPPWRSVGSLLARWGLEEEANSELRVPSVTVHELTPPSGA